jgi:hypothetical protein
MLRCLWLLCLPNVSSETASGLPEPEINQIPLPHFSDKKILNDDQDNLSSTRGGIEGARFPKNTSNRSQITEITKFDQNCTEIPKKKNYSIPKLDLPTNKKTNIQQKSKFQTSNPQRDTQEVSRRREIAGSVRNPETSGRSFGGMPANSRTHFFFFGVELGFWRFNGKKIFGEEIKIL